MGEDMFEKRKTQQNNNLGILREFDTLRVNENYIIQETNRKKLIKDIKDGEFRK